MEVYVMVRVNTYQLYLYCSGSKLHNYLVFKQCSKMDFFFKAIRQRANLNKNRTYMDRS